MQEQLEKTAEVFWRIDDSRLESLQESRASKIYSVRIACFRRRFADSLKQGQPKIRCGGKKSCRRGWLEAT